VATFEIADADGDLGAIYMVPGNTEKFRANFDYFLDRGVLLTSVTVAVTDAAGASAGGAITAPDRRAAVWFVTSGGVHDIFDLTLTVTTNDGQTLNYTIHYNVGGAL